LTTTSGGTINTDYSPTGRWSLKCRNVKTAGPSSRMHTHGCSHRGAWRTPAFAPTARTRSATVATCERPALRATTSIVQGTLRRTARRLLSSSAFQTDAERRLRAHPLRRDSSGRTRHGAASPTPLGTERLLRRPPRAVRPRPRHSKAERPCIARERSPEPTVLMKVRAQSGYNDRFGRDPDPSVRWSRQREDHGPPRQGRRAPLRRRHRRPRHPRRLLHARRRRGDPRTARRTPRREPQGPPGGTSVRCTRRRTTS